MKILMLNPNQIQRYNWGHQLFRNEVGRQHDVKYVGSGFPNFDPNLSVKEIIKKLKWTPDLIMTYGWRYSKDYKGLEEIDNIAKAHITIDYGRPEGIKKQNKFFKRNQYNLNFAISLNAYRLLTSNNPDLKTCMLPFSVDTNIYKPLNIEKQNMVLAAFTDRIDVYPNRRKIKRVLNQMGVKTITKRVVHQGLINAINKCKITVTSNNIFKSLSMRYTETMACGGLLLCDKPEDLEYMGFENNKHLVIYKNIEDFKKKIKYYLNPKNDTERMRISKGGMKFVRRNHSCEVRVKQMTEMITKELGIK